LALIDKNNDDNSAGEGLDPAEEIMKRISEVRADSDEGVTEYLGEEEEVDPVSDDKETGECLDPVCDDKETGELLDTSDETGDDTEKSKEDSEDKDLCVRCNVRRRDTSIAEDYEYCSRCRKDMLKVPLKWYSFLIAVAAFLLTVVAFAFAVFSTDVAMAVFEGDILARKDRLNDALASYTEAQDRVDELNSIFGAAFTKDDGTGYPADESILFSRGRKTLLKELKVTALAKGPLAAGYTLEELKLDEKAIKKYGFKSLKQYLDMYNAFKVAQEAVDPILSEYQEASPENVPYDELIKKIDELKTGENAGLYEPYFLEYYKTFVAVIAGKGAEAELEHLLSVKSLAPDALWLYGYYLADCYNRLDKYDEMSEVCDALIAVNKNSLQAYSMKGRVYCIRGEYDRAMEISDKMDKYNPENPATYAFKAEIQRRQGDVEAALETAVKGLAQIQEQGPMPGKSELFRQQAIALLLKNDNKGAYNAVNQAYESAYYTGETTLELVNTVALCAWLAEEKEVFEETVGFIERNGYKLSENVTAVKDGEKTVRDIFIGGKGDVL